MAIRKYNIPGVPFDPWTPPRPHGPRPLPANDAPPFRFRPKPKPGFGKRPFSPLNVPRGAPGRFLPGLGAGLLFLDVVDGLLPYRNPNPYKHPPSHHWCLVSYCDTGPPQYFNGQVRVANQIVGNACPSGAPFVDCIAGQAISAIGNFQWGEPMQFYPSVLRNGFWYQYNVGGGPTVRHKHWRSYRRVTSSALPYEIPFVPVNWAPLVPDPNPIRGMPGAPSPDLPIVPTPTPEAPFQWVWDSGPANSPRPRPRPSGKRPPPAGVKEKKTRTRKLMVAFFEVMDAVSENSEVINGFYEALPDSVQDKWGCAKRKGRQFIDSAGQYGIDHVDCKLQALWHNWHKVDAGLAIMNVAKNLTEDQLYGLLHRHLPPGAMQAMPDDTGKAWNEWVNGALELIFFGQ